jgi:hypothetical protein
MTARNSVLDPAASPTPFLAQPALWLQIAATVVVATMVAWLSRFWPVGPWNAVIWIAPPMLIAFLCNKGLARLVLAPLFALIFLATLVGNEAAAHLVFGTCLYD